jgi:hypothetical protein
MITLTNTLPQPPPAATTQLPALAPAANPHQPSDNRQNTGYTPPEPQTHPDETGNETAEDTDKAYAPMTSSIYNGGVMRRHIPMKENAAYIDPGNPQALLRRRAREYERMMLFY